MLNHLGTVNQEEYAIRISTFRFSTSLQSSRSAEFYSVYITVFYTIISMLYATKVIHTAIKIRLHLETPLGAEKLLFNIPGYCNIKDF